MNADPYPKMCIDLGIAEVFRPGYINLYKTYMAGNPGLAGFYLDFLSALHTGLGDGRTDSSAFFAFSYIGTPPLSASLLVCLVMVGSRMRILRERYISGSGKKFLSIGFTTPTERMMVTKERERESRGNLCVTVEVGK